MDVSPAGPPVRSSTERDHFRSSLIASSTTKYLSCRSWGLMSDSLRGLTSGDLLMPLKPGRGRGWERGEEFGEDRSEGDQRRGLASRGRCHRRASASPARRLPPTQLPRQPRRRVPSPMPGPRRLGAGQAGANGEGQDAVNFPSSPAARRLFPNCPASRLQRVPRPPAHPHWALLTWRCLCPGAYRRETLGSP